MCVCGRRPRNHANHDEHHHDAHDNTLNYADHDTHDHPDALPHHPMCVLVHAVHSVQLCRPWADSDPVMHCSQRHFAVRSFLSELPVTRTSPRTCTGT